MMLIENSDFRFCTKQELFDYICKLREELGREDYYANSNHGFVMKDRHFTYQGRGHIYDNNFDYDAMFKVSGDFIDGDIDHYCEMIVKHLNANQEK